MKEYTHYNCIKSVLAEKNKDGTWLSEQIGRNLGTVSQWMTNKVQPSVEQFYEIASQPRCGRERIISVVEMKESKKPFLWMRA